MTRKLKFNVEQIYYCTTKRIMYCVLRVVVMYIYIFRDNERKIQHAYASVLLIV